MTFFEQLMQTCWDNFYQFFVTGPGENIHTPVNIWVTGNFNRRMHGKEGENDLWGIFCRLKCLPIAVSHVSRLTWHTNVTANIVCGKWDEKKIVWIEVRMIIILRTSMSFSAGSPWFAHGFPHGFPRPVLHPTGELVPAPLGVLTIPTPGRRSSGFWHPWIGCWKMVEKWWKNLQ